MATLESVQSAGRAALRATAMMVLSVPSQLPMVEESVESVRNQVGSNGVSSTIQSVDKASTTLDAASAHQIVKTIRLTLVSHARRSHMEELLEHRSNVHQDSK